MTISAGQPALNSHRMNIIVVYTLLATRFSHFCGVIYTPSGVNKLPAGAHTNVDVIAFNFFRCLCIFALLVFFSAINDNSKNGVVLAVGSSHIGGV